MRSKRQRVGVVSSLTLALICLFNASLCFSAKEGHGAKPETVQDLRYGVALYHFFQQSYFDSLTELMVGESRQDLPNHSDTAELLRGGISLSYGLDKAAENIFTRLLEQHRQGAQRDAAWFYLAKLQYRRGDHSAAQATLQRVGAALEQPLAQEGRYMEANLLLRQGDLEQADRVAANLNRESAWLPYYYFNRGARLTAAGNWQEGVASFEQLQALPLTYWIDGEDGQQPDVTWEERKSLRDRAYTATGFAYLAAQEYSDAKEAFQQVRLSSPLVDRALLGYGWAAALDEKYLDALSPWETLRQRSLLDVSVQESLLAVPYAYEKLHAKGSALQEYQVSASLLKAELSNIQQAIELFSDSPLAELLQFDASLGEDWFVRDDVLPINRQAPYLAHLIARHSFQNSVKELRELYHLGDYLGEASRRLDIMRAVLTQREAVWRRKAEDSQNQQLQQRYDNLRSRYEQLQQQITAARNSADGIALLDEETLDLWQRIDRSSKRLARLEAAGENLFDERQKLRLAKGLILWQASDEYSANIWQLRKQQKQLQQLLAVSEPALLRVQEMVQSPDDLGFGQRIEELVARVSSQRETVDQQTLAAEQNLRQVAIAELQRQQTRLSSYLGQANLAIARLYDEGSEDTLAGQDAGKQPPVEEQGAQP